MEVGKAGGVALPACLPSWLRAFNCSAAFRGLMHLCPKRTAEIGMFQFAEEENLRERHS